MSSGRKQSQAVAIALSTAKKSGGHPNRHLNLGPWLHKRKTDKA